MEDRVSTRVIEVSIENADWVRSHDFKHIYANNVQIYATPKEIQVHMGVTTPNMNPKPEDVEATVIDQVSIVMTMEYATHFLRALGESISRNRPDLVKRNEIPRSESETHPPST